MSIQAEIKRAMPPIVAVIVLALLLWRPEREPLTNVFDIITYVLAFGLGMAWQATRPAAETRHD
jgi:hypothetical protein